MAKTKKLKEKKRVPSPKTIETPSQRLSGIIKSCRKIMRKDKGMNGDADRLPMLTWIMFLKFLDDNEQLQEVNANLEGKKYRPAIAKPYRWCDWARDKNLTGDDLLAFINNETVKLADGNERTGLLYYLRALQSETGTERKDVIATVFKGVINRMINGYLLRDVINKIDEIHFTNNEEVNTLSHLYESILKEMRDASGDAGEFYTPRPVVKFMVDMLDPQVGETILDPAAGTGGFLVEAFEHLKKQVKTVGQKTILQRKSIFGGEAKPLPYLLSQMNLLLHGLEYPNIDGGNSLRFPLRDIGDKDRVNIILTNPPFGGEEEKGILNNFPEDKRTSETAFLFLQMIMRKLKRKTATTEGGKAAIVVPKGTLFTEGVSARIMEQFLKDFEVNTIVKLAEGVFEPYTSITSYLIFFNHTGNPTKKIWYYEIIPSGQRKKYSKTKPIYYEEFEEIKKWWNKRKKNENCWTVSIDDVLQRDEKENLSVNLDFKNPNKDYVVTFADPLDTTDSLIEKQKSVTLELQEIKAELNNFYSTLSETFDLVPLSKVLQQYRVETWIEDNINYKQLTISKHEGIKQRGYKLGYDIGRKRQFIVDLDKYPNSILYTRQTLQQDEAIGLAPYEVNGCITTENMPMFTVTDAEPLYVHYFFKSNFFLKQLHKTSAKGTSQQTIHEDTFLTYLIPLPGPNIQKEVIRLLEKVIKLKEMQGEISNSLQELFPAILQKTFSIKQISLPILTEVEEKAFLKRKIMATYIINQSLTDTQFGDVKFEKLLHLSDYFAIKRNFGQKYYQQAAGPYDNVFTHAYFMQIEKAKWFKRKKNGSQFSFSAGQSHNKSLNTYNLFTNDELARVNKLITYFRKCDYEQPEIISTLYAVWNNRIIKNELITDELLKTDFLNWDAQKVKYKDRLDAALQWMKKEAIIPDGWGKVIEKAISKKRK